MPSSIFGKRGNSSIAGALGAFRALGDPGEAFRRMYGESGEFRAFADSMKGKTPEQAFRENGLDFGDFKGLVR